MNNTPEPLRDHLGLLCADHSKPSTLNPKSQTLYPQPQTLNPQPQTPDAGDRVGILRADHPVFCRRGPRCVLRHIRGIRQPCEADNIDNGLEPFPVVAHSLSKVPPRGIGACSSPDLVRLGGLVERESEMFLQTPTV